MGKGIPLDRTMTDEILAINNSHAQSMILILHHFAVERVMSPNVPISCPNLTKQGNRR